MGYRNGVTAAQWAADGKFVIAGLKGKEHQPPRPHGHVVIVVAGPLAKSGFMHFVQASLFPPNVYNRGSHDDKPSESEHGKPAPPG